MIGVFATVAIAALAWSVTPAIVPSSSASSTKHEDRVATTLNSVPLTRLLDGVVVSDASQVNSQIVGIMIENLQVVRPQAGLSAASVVYETLAEGGATRMLALFAGSGAMPKVGPVRSARPYYLEWAAEYDALFGHAGGSPDALRMISGDGYKDFNGISREAKYFFRDHSIAAPHNLFTTSELIGRALRDLGYSTGFAAFRPWLFKDDAPAPHPAANFLRADFTGKAYQVEYRYDPVSNSYARFNAGLPHTDANTGQQLYAKNVVVQVIPPILGYGEKGRLTLDIHGTGTAFLAIDGVTHTGTWTKASRTDRTIFRMEDGSEVQFNRGSTWVEVVPQPEKVEAGAL